jgi:predicted XRE-type DNA-binding protein
MKNLIIRIALTNANMKQWQLADLLGIHETTLCVKLRKELPKEEQERIVALIKENEVMK